jgi:DNA-binding transcriptional ArsR family regulator
VHFTAADIARTCVGPPPGPLAEAVFSLDALRRPGHDLVLDGWRDRLGELLTRTPALDPTTLDRALDASVTGNGNGRDEVAAALRRWFQVALAPYWTGIRALLESERRRLARLAGEQGVDTLLATLHPSMRWRPPVLHIQAGTAADHDCYLAGRGLAIVPSLFCRAGHPVCHHLDREAAPLVLYSPALADPYAARAIWSTGSRDVDASLVALLGRSRARVLQALGDGDVATACSTTDLATRAGVAVSSASEHATVLRRAGLVDSRRHRSTVFHRITGLGIGLLDAHRHPAGRGDVRRFRAGPARSGRVLLPA